MHFVKTNDGSHTAYSDEYKEHYHSTSGAVEETIEKYIRPTLIGLYARSGRVRVLDIGFGLGYNAAAAIDVALFVNRDAKIKVTSFEKNPDVFPLIQELNPPFEAYSLVKKIATQNIKDHMTIKEKKIKLEIFIGDATKTIFLVSGKYDAVFLDAFSPKKNPELWTVDFLVNVYRLMEEKAVLATYSCARNVRENLKAVGFIVSDGPIVGRRGPSTIAIKI